MGMLSFSHSLSSPDAISLHSSICCLDVAISLLLVDTNITESGIPVESVLLEPALQLLQCAVELFNLTQF